MIYLEEYRSTVRGEGIELDDVQLEACRALEEGKDVLLCAPTGSGKTMVARFAVELSLIHATTCIYTAPIKALSNQKYRELAAVYGEDSVGLMTGDITINRDAPIIVMTTEVLRNLIYARDPFAGALGYVILDEVHYLADEERGPVWEEILLELDTHTRVVSLSATVANAEEFHAWLESIRGTTALVETSLRPVPLIQHLALGRKIRPLFDGEGEAEIAARRPLSGAAEQMLNRRLPERVGPGQRARVLEEMRQRDLLPAIHFIYSRKGCELAVRDLDRERVILTTREERAAIHRALDPLRAELTDEEAAALHFRSFERALSRGYAAHHAGVYPPLKEIIERLMQEGHLKLVYATGTLALGINMPVRTTVVESLRRFNGTEFTDLTRIEYTQLIGRAGRRGRDKVGHAIVLACEDTASIGDVATGELEPLMSAFYPSYNTVLNVLTTYAYDEARALLARSFAQYQANRDLARLEIKRDRIRRELERQAELLADACDLGSLPKYLRLRLASGRAASRARKRARSAYRKRVEDSFFAARVGDIVAYSTEGGLFYGYLAQSANEGKGKPRVRIATWYGDLVWLQLKHLRSELRVVGRMSLPPGLKLRDPQVREQVAEQLTDEVADRINVDLDTDLLLPWDRAAVGETEELVSHPVHACEHLSDHLIEGEEYLALLRRSRETERMAGAFTDSVGAEFDTTCELLAHLGLLQGSPGNYRMGPGADTLKRIHASSDLTIYHCLLDSRITDLPVHEFAGMMSAFTFKDPRGRSIPPVNPLAWRAIVQHHEDIASLEESYGLDRQGPITSNATRAVAAWAQGAGLDECLRISHILPGDFIIGMRRTADLLAHIIQATDGDLSDLAHAARTAIVRAGVIDTP